MKQLTVAILFGGKSGEHEVSVASAQSVIKNIDRQKFKVMPIGITKEGRWLTGKQVQYLPVGPLQQVASSEQAIEPVNLDDLPKLASQVGLDQNKFKTCLDSGKYAQYVEDDYQSGIKAGVNGTPGNILLDTESGKTVAVPGAVPFEQLKSAIDSHIKI